MFLHYADNKRMLFRFFISVACLIFVFANKGVSSPAFSQTIHAVIVVDQDPRAKLGQNAKADHDNMIWLLQSNVPSEQLNLIILDVEQLNPETIMRKLQQLDVSPNDAVVFYYSGHGAYDPQQKEQYLQLDGRGNLYRNRIVEAIDAKSPRLSVILTDCCNVKAVPEKYVAPSHAPNKTARLPKTMSPLFESLFVFCKGTVDITSSKLGEYSFVDTSGQHRGSCFTYPLVELLDANKVNDEINWPGLIEKLHPRVNEAFIESFPKGYQGQQKQTMHVYALPGMSDATTGAFTTENTGSAETPPLTPTGPRLGLRAINHLQQGVRITGIIPDSPASKVGFQVGDVITEINVKKITNESDYSDAVDQSPKQMTVKVQRQGRDVPLTFSVELGW